MWAKLDGFHAYPEKELISSQLLAEPRITTFESFQIFVKIL